MQLPASCGDGETIFAELETVIPGVVPIPSLVWKEQSVSESGEKVRAIVATSKTSLMVKRECPIRIKPEPIAAHNVGEVRGKEQISLEGKPIDLPKWSERGGII